MHWFRERMIVIFHKQLLSIPLFQHRDKWKQPFQRTALSIAWGAEWTHFYPSKPLAEKSFWTLVGFSCWHWFSPFMGKNVWDPTTVTSPKMKELMLYVCFLSYLLSWQSGHCQNSLFNMYQDSVQILKIHMISISEFDSDVLLTI